MSEQASNGQLVKLLIESYDDEKFTRKRDETFTAMFNPNKYNLKYEIEYDKKAASGASANAPKFSNMKSQELSLEFFLDGTGVENAPDEFVDQKAEDFLRISYSYQSDKHKNNYLRITWSYLVFDCVLQDADIAYTLFRSDGRPLRAKITAKFLGFVNDKLRQLKDKAQSPDITHARMVADHDKLDYLAYKMYETGAYYLDVAKANHLVNFRKLRTGQTLYFPPLITEQKKA